MKFRTTAAAIAALFAFGFAGPAQAAKLDQIKSKGFIQCGVNGVLPGFSTPDDQGKFSGLDVDYCRALAAAVFGDATKVKFTPLTAKERFTALQSGEIDVLSRNTTWTFGRDTALGLNFVGVMYYDGQGIMVNKKLPVKSAKELGGATICINQGTTTELNLADFFKKNNLQFTPVTYEKMDEVVAAYAAGRCDAYTTDRSGLAAQRIKLKTPADHVILPEVLSKEPLGPVVQHGDDQWLDIAKWTYYALLNAEEYGVTSKNVDDLKANSTDGEIRRLLGVEGELGEKLGLPNDWAYQVVKQVGNYGEIYDKNVGPKTPIGLDRGVNALWNNGGLQYAPPMR
ncbi:MAG: amino acid ABC transporter substrate-binding protein [Pseudomonadota bacterium]|nr:amino acid ABC transporter substrate-binding protein [Pseudomonadota bacterium]